MAHTKKLMVFYEHAIIVVGKNELFFLLFGKIPIAVKYKCTRYALKKVQKNAIFKINFLFVKNWAQQKKK